MDVLKLKIAGAMGLGLEMDPMLERQSDSIAAPVWHAEIVEPFMAASSDLRTRLKGLEVSL